MKNNYFFRRILSAIVMLMASSLMWSRDFVVDGIAYNVNEDGESVEVTQYYDNWLNYYSGDIVIPSSVVYEGKTYSVTSIGNSAFSDCSSLASVVISNSVTSIENDAFSNCPSLASIVISNSVTSIGDGAFRHCSSLVSIEIPNSVTSIGIYAFEYCSSLVSVVISNSMTSIGYGTFEMCSSLVSIEIPNSVTSIGDAAFLECSSLTSVVIPNSVTSIGGCAFLYCPSLASIEIPNSVTNIGDNAFSNCPSLTSIIVADDNPIYDSREGCNAIIETTSNTLIIGCQNTVIPNSVISIGEYAFIGCSPLTSIVIPNSVTSIGEGAFLECSSLTSVVIPNSVTSIGNKAFGWCYSLTSVEIPNSVTSIGEYAFAECSSLATITCYAEDVPELDGSVFDNVPQSEATLYVPASALENYKVADQWKEFGTILPIDGDANGITSTTAEQETDATYYTLDGVSIKNPTKKGIYIKNGKKILVK